MNVVSIDCDGVVSKLKDECEMAPSVFIRFVFGRLRQIFYFCGTKPFRRVLKVSK